MSLYRWFFTTRSAKVVGHPLAADIPWPIRAWYYPREVDIGLGLGQDRIRCNVFLIRKGRHRRVEDIQNRRCCVKYHAQMLLRNCCRRSDTCEFSPLKTVALDK